ncbi:hypothetical protein ACN6LM_007217 [Streptomyces sp. SAS_281]|uniref:hypothetical protein n=1 Tax=Streptomyces sp. SAS_281 TaxID=3412744 RepID=UPI00403C3074
MPRLLPELLYAVRGWSGLGRRHPGPLLDAVERQLAEPPEPQRPEWWHRYAPGTAATAAARPAPWRTQLRLLRRHPEAEVRDAAYAEVTVRE